MLPLLMFTTIFLPLVTSRRTVDGGTNCRAERNVYGPVCHSDTSSFPHPGAATLQYLITVSGNQEICCNAYTCTASYCYMKFIGCGHHTWSSADLPWQGDSLSTPKMECKTSYRRPVYYCFKTVH